MLHTAVLVSNVVTNVSLFDLLCIQVLVSMLLISPRIIHGLKDNQRSTPVVAVILIKTIGIVR